MPDNLTLMDVSALAEKEVDKTIYKGFFEGMLPTPIDSIPIKNRKGFTYKTLRLTRTGRPTTRKIGGAAGNYKAGFGDESETISVIQDKITFDVELPEASDYITDPFDIQLIQWGDDLHRLMNELFAIGGLSGNDTEPFGIAYQLKRNAKFAGQGVDAGGLDIDASDDNRHAWLDFINEARRRCAGGAVDIMGMNAQTYLKFESALRRLRLLDTTKDQFGRDIRTYMGAKFMDWGMKPENALGAESTGQIIGDDTQTSIFGDANTTPIYFIHTGGDVQGAKIAQVHGLKTKNLGQNTADPSEIVYDARSTQGNHFPVRYTISSVEGLTVS